MPRADPRLLAAAGFAGGFVAGRAWGSPQARFARMTGSTIAAPDAAGWATDFLNAAYYRRPAEAREVDDLRLAFCVVTTFWSRRGHRRLRAVDVLPFHRAFGRDRFLDYRRSDRGTLDRRQLLAGAADLLGDWFPAAYADDARRGWGIAFPSPEEKAGYEPERRLALARVDALTPGVAPPSEQTWHTYPEVAMPSADAVVAALLATETWPDYASELGRFTPLRDSSLLGQTFEIEVAAGTSAGRPLFTRGYVTITRLVTTAEPEDLRAYVDELNDGLARFGRDEPAAVPPGATPLAAFDLTTHEGHFMGRGHNRLVLFSRDGRPFARAAGTWDPMPWHLEQAYRRAGRDAQHAFWGQGDDERQSMLHQLARRLAGRVPAAATPG
jgi:hypothetical protein